MQLISWIHHRGSEQLSITHTVQLGLDKNCHLHLNSQLGYFSADSDFISHSAMPREEATIKTFVSH
jgi:hypothetical protein